MRVLALVTDAFGGYGGISQYNRDFLSALAQSPLIDQVVVIPRIGAAAANEPPPKIRQLTPVYGKAAYSLTVCRTAMSGGSFDFVFCGHIYAAPLGAFVARMLGVPLWLQTHGIDAWECPSRTVWKAVEYAALVTTVSRYTRKRMLEWTKIHPARIRVLPNTVRPLFSPGPKSDGVLEKYGLAGKKIILTVSRVSKADSYKGHGNVIEALPEVLNAYPDVIYVVAGSGDGRSDLEQLVAKLNLQDCTRFLGRISDEDVLALYRSSTVFIMPSSKEGFGIVFTEAAAAGLPVIGGNQDGSVDALADGHIGRAVDPNSLSEIVAKLKDALAGRLPANPQEVQRFAFPKFAAHVHELVRTFAH
jgi:phosphatidylinositol alpha-1,6-mannosyltransferase